MTVITGIFNVDLLPQQDQEFDAGRMLIDKTYQGDLSGKGSGQMLSTRTEQGTACYCALEHFRGTLQGKTGEFSLIHNGFMSAQEQTLTVEVISGSATGELQGLTGNINIRQENGQHYYDFDFELP